MVAGFESSDESDRVWQGYVSAVSCVLLALLLLMSVLALAIVLGSAAGQDESAAKEASRAAATPKSPRNQAQWVLRFPKDTWRFNNTQRTELTAQFARANATGQNDWLAWVQMPDDKTDNLLTSAGSSREAYLRLLAVRDLLLAAGIKPVQINLQILTKPPLVKTVSEPSDATVMLAVTGGSSKSSKSSKGSNSSASKTADAADVIGKGP
jgi:hypothetical protein